MQYVYVEVGLTYHARMKIKHVAQKFVPTVKPQMDHLRAWLRLVWRTDPVVKRSYVITALVTEIAGK
jgi:hypothetical protein